MTQYSWAVTQGMTVTGWEDSTIELPSDVPPAAAGRLKAWRIQYPLGVAGWQMQGPKFTAWDSYNVYDTFNLWLQGDPAGIKLQFNNDKGNSLLLDMEACDPYPDPDPNNTLPILQQDSWWKITVSMSQFQVSGLNMIQLIKWNEPAAEIRAVGYFGWPDGVDRTVMPSDLPLPLPLPADLKYKTQSQSYANSGDRGLVCNWHCSDGSDMRPATDLFDVPIYAYRDTSVGPLPMQGMTESTTLENGVYSFQWIWNNTNIKTRLVSDYPSPYYACPCVEADYYEIGDTSTADYVLTAWIPYNSALGEQLTDPLVSYAQWVKNSRQHDSNVAVIVRMRVPNEAPFNGSTTAASGDWMWVQSVAPDCKNVTYKGFCPDHIWFLDTQMGALHLDLKRLAPLTEWNTQYFKKTGYDISYDMLPAIDKLVYYSGEYYGLPVQIQHPDWHIHYAAVHYLWSMGMKAPPPIDEWGGGWWGEWNMKEFNKIVKVLWDGGYRNIVQLPGNYDVTSFFQYIVSSWGATMLSGTGRCGLDEYAERAITETFVEWLKHPGMLQPRIPWDTDPAIVASWNEWLTSPPKEKPWEEPIFKMKEMSPVETPGEPGSDTSKDFMSFSLASAWGANSTGNPRFIKMYPPTGVAQINGIFAGMARTSRNKTIAHDALMGAIARNKRLQANVALRFGRIWQQRAAVSGYVSAFQLPDYELAIKPSYARMLSDEQILKRASFAGYPVQQFSSFGLIAPFDPINLMFNEIQYKGLSVKEAMDRACQTINWITMPPCGPENWEPYLIDDPTTNQASVHYRWQANKSEVCREDVTLAQSLPSPIVAAVPLTYTSTQSPQAKAMIVLMGIGIALEATMMGLFLWFSNTQVIRAASKIPSVLIFVGAIFTLASVIMRVTTGDRPTWFQCFGTYWFFAIGFCLVLGSLAMKSYRIDAIFRSMTAMKFSDAKLVGLIGLILLGECIFCLIYQFWLQNGTGKKIADLKGLGVTLEQLDCPVPNNTAVILLFVYNGILVLLAAYFAFKTRKIVSAFNESSFTAAAIALICIISIIIVPVLSMISSPQAIFMLIALGTFIATVLSTAVFAVPKLLIAVGIWQMEDMTHPNLKSSNPSHKAVTSATVGSKGQSALKTDSTGGSSGKSHVVKSVNV